MQHDKKLSGDDHPDKQSEDDTQRRPPPAPALDGDLHHREVTHDTDICLKISVDGKDKGNFLEFETSVKVRWLAKRS
jgi:hypothetical protein